MEHGNLFHHGLEGVVGDGLAHGFDRAARLEPERHCRAGLGIEHVPTLCFAARLAGLLSQRIVRMHLDGELVVREEDFDQQRIIADFVAMGTEQRIRIGRG